MFGECHAHFIMNGINYKEAVALHQNGVQDLYIRQKLEQYKARGVTFIRDGGDALGVSRRTKELAPEYGIDYRTPVFAIHKTGYYGGIVGKAFSDMRQFRERVQEAKDAGADFIKIMTTGILDFAKKGEITGTPLDENEVLEMVEIAHDAGMAVMSHTNGVYGVRAALKAGVDSLEHGNFMDEETICMLAESNTVWVPTLVTVCDLIGSGRFPDEDLQKIAAQAAENVRLAWKKGAQLALGSDAGAYRVYHGQGIEEEYQAFTDILGDNAQVRKWLEEGEKKIRSRFQR